MLERRKGTKGIEPWSCGWRVDVETSKITLGLGFRDIKSALTTVKVACKSISEIQVVDCEAVAN
ncbi:hypothetical protein SLEP1_g49401 [Rubroshorea leprosula]|uniref:Uncharacterized protein n=1 Tax=Rubroshorea leprosula TaxID=152421 RepID=A0AAV5LYS5_9ROSI|nr:hypothetical protein SLEP1_g49401 [Rubroshorea leprosula]